MQRKNTLTELVVGVLAGVFGVVVHAECRLVEHLDGHLAVAFVEEGEQAADLEVVGAGELLPPGVQVHLALPIEQDLDRPAARAAAGLAQPQLGRLDAINELGELVREALDAEGVVVDAEEELEAPRILGRRR